MRNLILAFYVLSALLGTVFTTTIYLAGDSTMARGGGGSGTDGWGQYIASDVSVNVSNLAIGGRSARSFTREGHFDAIVQVINSGDYVVIEFGHNDGGSLTPTDNGRTDCPGTGNETCHTVYNGVSETVLTFPAYFENVSRKLRAKGAHVLFSSQTPNNPWESGTFSYSPSRFVGYAKLAAGVAGVQYVDHGAYVADIFKTLGSKTVDSYFPNDHTHTSPTGAKVVAQAFLKGVVCGHVDLSKVVTVSNLPGNCIS